MVKYNCLHCGRLFTQKGHLTKHNNRKTPCVDESKVKETIEKTIEKMLEQKLNSLNIDTANKIHTLGQYFTRHIKLKEKVFEFILNNPSNILEPSIGQGDLINFIMDKLPEIMFDMYEIDSNIKLLDKIQKNDVIYGDFMKQTISKRYKTIVGNPPYVRTKKGNLYIDFTEKCYNLLDENGELIFMLDLLVEKKKFLKMKN